MFLDVVLEKPLWSDRILDDLFKTEPNRTAKVDFSTLFIILLVLYIALI